MSNELLLWGKRDIEKLKALTRDHTVSTIARMLKRSEDQVRYQIRKYGFKTKAPGERTFAELLHVRRYSDRNGIKKAAHHFNVSVDVIKNIRRRHQKIHSQFTKEVPQEELIKLRRIARCYANKKGYSQLGDDFASYACIRMMARHTVNLRWAFVDFLREHCGDIRRDSGYRQAGSHFNYVEIVEEPNKDEETPNQIQISGEDGREIEQSTFKIEEIADKCNLKMKDRSVFLLHYKWGFSLGEIGALLGFTESRACQLLKEIHVRVRTHPNVSQLLKQGEV